MTSQRPCCRRRHDPLRQAGRERALPGDGRGSDQARARGRRRQLRHDPAGLCRLCLRRLDLRTARALPGRHDRHSHHQREQQLLDRLDRAVHGAAGDRIRRARLRAGARLRTDEARRARRRLHRPAQRIRRVRRGRQPARRCPRRAAGAALFRRRGPQSHEEIRHAAVVVCESPRQGEPARQEQSAGAIPQGSHRRRRHERSGDLARRHDPPDGLPADLRRRGGRAGVGEVRQQAWPEQESPDRRAGDDDRHGLDLRRRRHDAGGRLRHDAKRGQQGL